MSQLEAIGIVGEISQLEECVCFSKFLASSSLNDMYSAHYANLHNN